MRKLAAGLVLQTAFMGCTITPPPTVEAPSSLGWPDELVQHPETFSALMDASSRDGWVALHGHRYQEALTQFRGDTAPLLAGQLRATSSLAQLHADLARAQSTASKRYFDELKQRDALATDSTAGRLASLSMSCETANDAFDEEASPTFAAVRDGWSGTADLAVGDALIAFRERHSAHVEARGGEPQALVRLAQIPLVVEPAQGFDRTWWDPCLHSSLAQAWQHTNPHAKADDASPLSTILFSPWAQLSDTAGPAHAPASMASWSLNDGITTDTAKPEAARRYVRNLDAKLDAMKLALASTADADGLAMLEQIGVVDRFRQEHLTALARAQMRDEPASALATLTLARDVVNKDVGPSNGPALMALLAEANLRTGRTREALDALQILFEVHPEVHGLQELVGDLAVLQGLDRQGDSKEH